MITKFRKKTVKDKERRLNRRAEFFQSSYFLPLNEDAVAKSIDCWFNNISQGGMAVETVYGDVKNGDELIVLFKIGTQIRKETLKVQNISKVPGKYRYGCAFTDPDEQRKNIIEGYINRTAGQSVARNSL